MNDDLTSLSLEELERRCTPEQLHHLRLFPRNSDVYRKLLISTLTPRPRLPVDELLKILRQESDRGQTWQDIISLLERSVPSVSWDSLARPDIEGDLRRASQWLERQHLKTAKSTGIYLGLDTLNMRGGRGTNVEIGFSTSCDPIQLGIDWVFEGLSYGAPHLIGSLVPMKATYSAKEWKTENPKVPLDSAERFADYMIFLGYSGLILREAFRSIHPWSPAIVIWGFHDGDLFHLGRTREGCQEFLFS